MGLAQGPPDSPTGLAAFLGRAMDAPHSLSVRNAVELLRDIGALDSTEFLTDFGGKLAQLSVDPRVGKMMLWAYLFGCARCV
jgi:HrpA-like RNA helicase